MTILRKSAIFSLMAHSPAVGIRVSAGDAGDAFVYLRGALGAPDRQSLEQSRCQHFPDPGHSLDQP